MTYKNVYTTLTLSLLTGITIATLPLWYNPDGHGGDEMFWAMASMYASPVLIVISILGIVGVAKYRKIDRELK